MNRKKICSQFVACETVSVHGTGELIKFILPIIELVYFHSINPIISSPILENDFLFYKTTWAIHYFQEAAL